MRVHHLNCGSMCPFGGGLFEGHGSWLARQPPAMPARRRAGARVPQTAGASAAGHAA